MILHVAGGEYVVYFPQFRSTEWSPAVNFRVLILAVGAFVIGTDAFVVAGVMPDIAARLDVSTTQVAHLITVFAISYAVASPVLGAAFGHWERRRLLLLALTVFVASNVVSAVASTYGLMVASRVFAGIGAALFTPTAIATAAMLVPPERQGRAVAGVGAGLTIATVIGVPLATLLGTGLSFRWSFWAIAIAGALAAIVVRIAFERVPSAGTATLRQRVGVVRVPGVTPTLLVSLCAFVGGFSVYTYISPLFTDRLGIDAQAVTVLLLAFGVAGAIGNTLGGRLADQIGPERTVQLGLVLAAAGLLMIPFVDVSWPGSVVAVVVWGVGGWMQVPAQQSRLISAAGRAAPMAISLNASAMYLGIGLAGLLGSVVIDVAGLDGLGPFGGAMGVIGLALTAVYYRRPALREATA
jgi:predicted MFS family arabinose efflux permease